MKTNVLTDRLIYAQFKPIRNMDFEEYVFPKLRKRKKNIILYHNISYCYTGVIEIKLNVFGN